jgi:hypothetical protein
VRVRVLAALRVRSLRSGRARVRVSCQVACSVKAVVQTARRPVVTVATGADRVARREHVVRLRLTARGRRLVRTARRLRLVITATGRGGTATATRRVT